jgi:hypothetical protein
MHLRHPSSRAPANQLSDTIGHKSVPQIWRPAARAAASGRIGLALRFVGASNRSAVALVLRDRRQFRGARVNKRSVPRRQRPAPRPAPVTPELRVRRRIGARSASESHQSRERERAVSSRRARHRRDVCASLSVGVARGTRRAGRAEARDSSSCHPAAFSKSPRRGMGVREKGRFEPENGRVSRVARNRES